MFRIERCARDRCRVIGRLDGNCIPLLSEALSRGATTLDLAEVDRADEVAVRFLAGLAPERCVLTTCPTWLALWIERVRQRAY